MSIKTNDISTTTELNKNSNNTLLNCNKGDFNNSEIFTRNELPVIKQEPNTQCQNELTMKMCKKINEVRIREANEVRIRQALSLWKK